MSDTYWTRQARRYNRRKFVSGTALGAVGAGALALVGCGDDDKTKTTPAGTAAAGGSPAAASPTAAPAGGTPVAGSYFSQHQVNAGTTLDMHRELFRQNASITTQAYNNLIAWDDLNKGTIAGEIAEKWEQVDPLTYTFTLRDGVKWQNKAPANGRALTMEDVKWNIERQRAGKLADGTASNFPRRSESYDVIDKVDYVDEKHLTIKLKNPKAPWLSTMCEEFNVIMLKEVTEAIEKDFATFDPKYIVGTGPYIIDSYTLAKGAHMTRNPDYFLKKAGQQVQFVDEQFWTNLGPDLNAIRTALEGKQIDVAGGAPLLKDAVEAIMASQKDLKKVDVPNPNGNLELGYAWKNSPAFSNPKIRQAIFIALDRQLVAQQEFQGNARPTPAIPWAFTEWTLPQTELAQAPGYRANKDDDIKEARALWAAGGGPALDKALFEMIIIDVRDQAIKEWFPAMMNKNLGTDKFSARAIPVSSLLEYDRSQNSVGYLGGWDQWTSPDPRQRFANTYSKDGNINFWQYYTPEMEDLIQKSFLEFDRAKAILLLKDAQRLALKDGGAGHLQMVGAITPILHWPYLHEDFSFITYARRSIGRLAWIDQKDPTFAGRKKPS
jgi:peptide/nickel transport system substrate-binding protein